MIHIGAVDPHLPLGACCVYKITHIATGKAYIGKTVAPLEWYIKHDHMRRTGHIGNALRKHGRAAFRSEILLVGSEDFCFRDVIDGERGGMERRLIAAYGTLARDGYNLTDGGEGWSSEDARKVSAIGAEVRGRRAGYPLKRVLAILESADEWLSIRSIAALTPKSRQSVGNAIENLRLRGLYIVCAGDLYRLFDNAEDAAMAWPGGREVTFLNRTLGWLMEGPRTSPELMALLGMSHDMVHRYLSWLRKKDYNIKCRGAGGHVFGTYHLIIDHKRHPWLHLSVMDLRGAALDDRCN